MRVIGLISGTSMDGIDAAVGDLEFDERGVVLRPLGSISVPYSPALRDSLERALPPASTTAEEMCRLDNAVGQAFGEAAREAAGAVDAGDADLVVSHGQTVFHHVEDGRVLGTLQIGQPAWIAEATGLPVVADLRTRDVAVGGQGAPLVSMFDVLLLAGSEEPVAALNLGGIANLTIVSAGSDPVGFDIGPANALIDAAVQHVTGGKERFDRDGLMAGRGRVDPSLLDRLRADPYYQRPHPKTTGKELFNLSYLLEVLENAEDPASVRMAPEDLVATVTALTAVTVAEACQAHRVTRVIAAGGGTANPVLMSMLEAQLPSVTVAPIDELGVPSGAKEAYAFALLGFLTVHNLPGNVPPVTGATRAVVLGSVVPGRKGFPQARTVEAPPDRLRIAFGGDA